MNKLVIQPDAPWLAPLAGYSDLPFRMLCREHGCTITCTEMVSVKGLVYGGANTERLCDAHPDDSPAILQLFGADPDSYGPAMDKVLENGNFEYFDLNAGCPVRKVTTTGAGSKLLMDTERLYKIVATMVAKAGAGRVGVKTRLGWEKGDDVYIDVARRLEELGVAWITLHPRYGKQMFAGDADWSKLARLKEAVNIPVVASGDLYTAEDGLRCLEETGVDAIMFARGALYDPAIFARFNALRAGTPLPQRTGMQLATTVRRHIELTRQYNGSARSFRHIRSLLPRYAKGLRGIRTLRQQLLECTDWDELLHTAGCIADLEPLE
jgi:tRNA-dihydrouridine synthase B